MNGIRVAGIIRFSYQHFGNQHCTAWVTLWSRKWGILVEDSEVSIFKLRPDRSLDKSIEKVEKMDTKAQTPISLWAI